MFYKCFNQYVINYLGNKCDCHIANYNFESDELVINDSSSINKHTRLEILLLGADEKCCLDLEKFHFCRTICFEEVQRCNKLYAFVSRTEMAQLYLQSLLVLIKSTKLVFIFAYIW